MKDDQDIIAQMKAELAPQGTAPLVRLFLREASYFKKEFVDACIKEMETLPARAAVDSKISALEKLAVRVLVDSAYLNQPGD